MKKWYIFEYHFVGTNNFEIIFEQNSSDKYKFKHTTSNSTLCCLDVVREITMKFFYNRNHKYEYFLWYLCKLSIGHFQ